MPRRRRAVGPRELQVERRPTGQDEGIAEQTRGPHHPPVGLVVAPPPGTVHRKPAPAMERVAAQARPDTDRPDGAPRAAEVSEGRRLVKPVVGPEKDKARLNPARRAAAPVIDRSGGEAAGPATSPAVQVVKAIGAFPSLLYYGLRSRG